MPPQRLDPALIVALEAIAQTARNAVTRHERVQPPPRNRAQRIMQAQARGGPSYRGATAVWDADGYLVAGTGDGGIGVTVGPTAPVNPLVGALWFDTGSDTLMVWDGSTWQSAQTAGVAEAPLTGGPYARQTAAWVPVSSVTVGDVNGGAF